MPDYGGGYAANPQQAKAKADHRLTAHEAGYMELTGAKKDADCRRVKVDGGVSKELGCCNEFRPQHGVKQFRCGTCGFLQPHAIRQ